MKAVVVKKYRDKKTKKIMEVGSEVELSEERFAEILAAGEYVKKVEKLDETNEGENPEEQQEEPEESKKRGGRKGKE